LVAGLDPVDRPDSHFASALVQESPLEGGILGAQPDKRRTNGRSLPPILDWQPLARFTTKLSAML
jgi:hypothetical protein